MNQKLRAAKGYKPTEKLGNPRWQKGVSGNPAGRPKGTVIGTPCMLDPLVRDAFLATLNRLLLNRFDLELKKMGNELTGAEKVALGWIKAASTGDVKAISLLVDRILGKLPQVVTGGEPGSEAGPIVIKLIKYAGEAGQP